MFRGIAQKNIFLFALLGGFSLWLILHIPSVFYGTENTPLHVSYMSADEQSPVNGALHMLQEKNIFGLKNQNTLYYGPVFSLFALPAVVIDFVLKIISGEVTGAESYKNYIVWDWGGILQWVRASAVTVSFLVLLAVFLLFQTRTINPSRNKLVPYVASLLLASNFLFFEYSSFFRHWIFIVTFLLWQLYFVILLNERRDKTFKYWVLQSLLTIASFGTSYLSVIYQIFWIPVLIEWYRKKEWRRFKEFSGYLASVVAGFALVIWWHPYGFLRILGLTGIIKPVSIGAALDLGTQGAQAHSFLFYATVFTINTLPLILCAFLILFWTFKNKKRISDWWVWAIFLLPALTNYIIFSIPTHHESRYILPSVVLFLVLVCIMFSQTFSAWGNKKFVPRAVYFLFVCSLVVGFIQIVLWQRMILDGPPERREVISQIHEWQQQDPTTKTLVVKNWPLGYVHTGGAYSDYVERYNKSSYDLWQYILKLPPPDGITPLNVYYLHADEELTDGLLEEYDHVVRHNPAVTGKDVVGISPNDEFDIRPWNLWNYEKYQESFTIVK